MGRPIRKIDQFAELLSEHVHAGDIAAGRASKLDQGGNVQKCAIKLGMTKASGNGLMQRIRRQLGDQAR